MVSASIRRWLLLSPGCFLFLLGVIPIAQTTADEKVLPAQKLDLSNWKLTLPTSLTKSAEASEITQPALASFQAADCFFVNASGDAVVFRAHCGGVTTKGSSYPRCELREMQADGRKEADWATSDRKLHAIELTMAITHLPSVKSHVVCAQIHDEENDVLMVRLEKSKLLVERTGADDILLDPKYSLATPFTLRIEAAEGKVRLWYNQELKMDWRVDSQGCYFKAGCYTQSNVKKGDAAEDFAEVLIYHITK